MIKNVLIGGGCVTACWLWSVPGGAAGLGHRHWQG
jgi:hypothetical protein